MKILNTIQQKLKVPKSKNPNVPYKSRSAEDIIEMVKPLLGGALLTLSDEIVLVGERYYVKATATLTHEKESFSVTAYARESLEQRAMSEAQVSGSASSYARKYALNGLLLIDDTQDDDTREHVEVEKPKNVPKEAPKKTGKPYDGALANINKATRIEELTEVVTKIQASKLLTVEEKADLVNISNFKAEELTIPEDQY